MNIAYTEPPATSEPVATEVLPTPVAGLSPGAFIRISWRAIFAGLVLVLAIEILLNLLGAGVGLNAVNPSGSGTPNATSFGIGAGIWWMVSTIIAFLFGCYAAARLAGVASRWDGVLHGLVIWGGGVLIAVYLVTATIGGLIGGAFSVLGSAVSAAPRIEQTTTTGQAPIGSQQAQRVDKAKNQVVQTAKQTAGPAAATASEAALLAFAAMVISLIAAGIGGALASPRPPFLARWLARPGARV